VYLLVVVLCWAEAAFFLGFVTPGELAVAAGGILASRGQVTVAMLFGVVVVGTLAGNATGYALGRRWGAGILGWGPLRTAFGPSIDGAEAFMRKRGEWAIVLGRLTTPTRIVVPFLAGSSGLPYRRFVIFDVPATLAWAAAWIGIGYLLGESWEILKDVAGTAALLVLLLFVAALVIRSVTAHVAANQRRVQAAFRLFLRVTGTTGIARRLGPALGWMGRRLDPRLALGLNLTVAFLALVVAVGAVGLVMSQTRAVRGLALLDFPVLDWMVATRTDEAVRVARGILEFLRWPGVVALALPAAGLTAWTAGWVAAFRVTVGLVGAGGGAYALDQFVLEGIVPGAEFPSVPVTVAAVFVVHATAVAARRWGWTPAVVTAGVGTFALCAVALGTVVAGWAAPSGIALGLALGLGWATLLELPRTLLPEESTAGAEGHEDATDEGFDPRPDGGNLQRSAAEEATPTEPTVDREEGGAPPPPDPD
jgi:membrane protein DedA with SNARE-associated domain